MSSRNPSRSTVPRAKPWEVLGRRPWLLALVISTLVVEFGRFGPDWPAQEFRAKIAHDFGLLAWNNQWYGGHPLPSYSLIYPAIAALLGAAITGVVAAVGCSLLVTLLLPPTDIGRRRFGVAAAIGVAGDLFLGQVPFLLGLCFGLAALHLRRRAESGWRASLLVAVLAALCSLASPLAGFFLLLGALAWALNGGWAPALPLAGAIAGPAVSVAVGGSGGPFPFPWIALLGMIVFVGAMLLLLPRRQPLLRSFLALYATVSVLSFVVANPVGGNVTRLAQLVVVPAVAWLSCQYRRVFSVAAVAIPALCWQLYPIGTAAARVVGDPSVTASYFSGLLHFISTQKVTDGRLEIPLMREHWEAATVAPLFPIARGWERQTDYQYDQVLYRPLTSASYRIWLASAGVALVALPDAPLDYGGQAERLLLASPPPYLKLVWHDAHWKVWKVTRAQPLVAGPATLTKLDTSSFELSFRRAGDAIVRLRMSTLWNVDSGKACLLADQPDGWVHVRSAAKGPVTVSARISWSLLFSDGSLCPSPTSVHG